MSLSTAPYMARAVVPATPTSVSVGSSSVMIAAANANRNTITISNSSTGLGGAVSFITFSSPAAANKGIALGPGANITLYRSPAMALYAITPGLLTVTLCVQEYLNPPTA